VTTRHAPRLDREFVARWGQRYKIDDHELLDVIGPAVARRGSYTKPELARVGDWKSPRIRSRIAANSDADIEDITRIALSAPDRLQHRVLTILRGVKVPVASAILTVWDPNRHTVLDGRATEALDALLDAPSQHKPGQLPDYLTYLDCCRTLAGRLDVSLRDLDRALWQWSKEGMPDQHPS